MVNGPASRAPVIAYAFEPNRLVELRLFRPDLEAVRRTGDALGLALAEAPNIWNGRSQNARLGPGEWVFENGPPAEHMNKALAGFPAYACDVTAGRRTWRVEGDDAAPLLQSGCPLDLDPDRFGAGTCTRTVLAKLAVILSRPGAAPRFQVTCERPYAAYLEAWLEDAQKGFPYVSRR
jgi:sarcosine oxidase subunit gamma